MITKETLEPCPLSHHVSAGLRVNKTDPRIHCLDRGLSIAATDWTTLYERWNTRLSPASAAPVVDELKLTIEEVIRQFRASQTHKPTYCCPEDESVYDRILTRMLVEKLAAAATAAPVDQSDSLLAQIAAITDLGSAEEFGDALERLRSIRKLIDEHEGAR